MRTTEALRQAAPGAQPAPTEPPTATAAKTIFAELGCDDVRVRRNGNGIQFEALVPGARVGTLIHPMAAAGEDPAWAGLPATDGQPAPSEPAACQACGDTATRYVPQEATDHPGPYCNDCGPGAQGEVPAEPSTSPADCDVTPEGIAQACENSYNWLMHGRKTGPCIAAPQFAEGARLLRTIARLAIQPSAGEAEPGERFELTKSIIHKCPALRLPQTFLQRLGGVAQLVVLKGADDALAEELLRRLNATAVPDATRIAAAIEEALAGHRMTETLEEDETSGLLLLDKLCSPGATDIGSGRREIDYLVDVVLSAVTGALVAAPNPPAARNAELSDEQIDDLIRSTGFNPDGRLRKAIRTILATASSADARDAARYRWLRVQHEQSDSAESFCVFEPTPAHDLSPVGSMPGELDEAIDAAIAAEKGGKA